MILRRKGAASGFVNIGDSASGSKSAVLFKEDTAPHRLEAQSRLLRGVLVLLLIFCTMY